jgi:catechol 1,2-dioxygenase
MTTDATGAGVTEQALASLRGTADPRLRELLTGLVRHLHDFARGGR